MFITGLTSSAKLYSHPLKKNVIIEIHKNHTLGSHISSRKGCICTYLLKRWLYTFSLSRLEVIWHQHHRDLNMAHFIHLEKYKINGTGYYSLGGKCLELSAQPTNLRDGERGCWRRRSTTKTLEQEWMSFRVGEGMPGGWCTPEPWGQKLLGSAPFWALPYVPLHLDSL